MRVDLSEMEQGEGPLLIFPKRTGVYYTWRTCGLMQIPLSQEGYIVPVGDSIVRSQLRSLHLGCCAQLNEAGADALDSVFTLAGMPFAVDRESLLWPQSTENAVWVRFPRMGEQVPIPGSRYEKWARYWARHAVFVWWQCESVAEWRHRMADPHANEPVIRVDGTLG